MFLITSHTTTSITMNNIFLKKKNLQNPPLYNSFQETLRQLLWKTSLGRDSSVQILLVNSHTSKFTCQ